MQHQQKHIAEYGKAKEYKVNTCTNVHQQIHMAELHKARCSPNVTPAMHAMSSLALRNLGTFLFADAAHCQGKQQYPGAGTAMHTSANNGISVLAV